MADSTRYARGAPPLHPTTPLPALWFCDALNASGVTMGPYYCFSGVGGHVRHRGFGPMGPTRKREAQSETRPKSLGLSGGNAANPAVTNGLGLYVRWGVYACPSQTSPNPGRRPILAPCPRSPPGSQPPSPTATKSKATSAKAAKVLDHVQRLVSSSQRNRAPDSG